MAYIHSQYPNGSNEIFYDEPFFANKAVLSGIILGGAAATAAFYFYWTTPSSSTNGRGVNRVPGLINLGNTCYTNSLMQALAGCPSLIGWLKEVNIVDAGLESGFIDSLKEVILGLDTNDGGVLSAGGIVRSLAKHGWNIEIGEEHDLYELFNVFVTTWDDELKFARRNLMHGSIEDCRSEQSKLDSPISVRKMLSFESTATFARLDARLRAPCIGLIATEYRCCNVACGFRTVKYESFSALTLSIPNSLMGASTSVEHLLKRYFCSEIIRDAVCDKCKKTSRKQMGFLKKHGIVKLPQTLIIRVERVGMLPSGHLKLTEHVAFGEWLSVQEVCFRKNSHLKKGLIQADYEESAKMWQLPDGTSRVLGGAEQSTDSDASPQSVLPVFDGESFAAKRRETQKYAYQLRAVSEHRGGPSSGHFVTYRRGSNNKSWFLTNDAHVTRVTYSQVALCQAYMLFYERIRPNRWYHRG